ncbi:hypothetical protein [Polaromonas sp.]|uniref:hypothetical protein n=1 Tax=Polaromonas sp. TaxID=1869339 RepID=UPI0025DB378C|nr:hypothetical protein [Polaromonas sp.]
MDLIARCVLGTVASWNLVRTTFFISLMLVGYYGSAIKKFVASKFFALVLKAREVPQYRHMKLGALPTALAKT